MGRVSSAVRPDNPEVAAARARNIPVIPRAEMLGELMRVKDGVAVAGSHGKTTTTTMIAVILAEAGLDPTAVIGGKARAFGSNARLGQGEILVAEADESDGSFRHLFPTVAVVTNIDREHLDHFGSEEALFDRVFGLRREGAVLWIGRDRRRQPGGGAPGAARLTKRHTTYGLAAGDWRGEILDAGPTGTRFRVRVRGRLHGEARVRMPGVHYAGNALAALCVADFLGVPFADGRRGAGPVPRASTAASRCAARRAGVLVVDDYGHHPTELAATVAAARLYGRRLVVAFQPHRFTRTRDLLADFAPALAGADELLLTDIYAAGEAPIAGVDAAALLATFPAGARCATCRAIAGADAGRAGPPRRSGAVPRRRRHHRRAGGAADAARHAREPWRERAATPLGRGAAADRRRSASRPAAAGCEARRQPARSRARSRPFAAAARRAAARWLGRKPGASPARCWRAGRWSPARRWRAASWSAT